MLTANEAVWIKSVRNFRFYMGLGHVAFIAAFIAAMVTPNHARFLPIIVQQDFPGIVLVILGVALASAAFCTVRLRQLQRCPRCGGAFFGSAFSKHRQWGFPERRIQDLYNRRCPECGLDLAELQ